MNIQKIAELIKFPVTKWPGNCYGLAMSFVKHGIVNGIARYGHYTGPIKKGTMFYKLSATGFIQHGWVELRDGTIVDPTRFVFEGKAPYIYVGKNDYYDVGGSNFRDNLRSQQEPPKFDSTQKVYKLELGDNIIDMLNIVCQDDCVKKQPNEFSLGQIFWIGNENPRKFGKAAKKIYAEFKRLKQTAVIPQDYWTLIMNDD